MADEKVVLSVSKPTPMWATWIFRIEFWINKTFLFLLAQGAFEGIEMKKALIWALAIDGFVWGIGRMLGIKKPEDDTNN